jgi:hypothetical protein
MSSTFWSQFTNLAFIVISKELCTYKRISFSEACIESCVIIYININQVRDNTVCNKYYIN